jgi:hypothetical protein
MNSLKRMLEMVGIFFCLFLERISATLKLSDRQFKLFHALWIQCPLPMGYEEE